MKIKFNKHLFQIIFASLFTLISVACSDDDRDIELFSMVIASEKLDGIITDACLGNSREATVFAAKINGNKDWESFSDDITGFEYESGFEYTIIVEKETFNDPQMSVTRWEEFTLQEVVSKEKRSSEGLPTDFIPDWFENKPKN